MKIENVKPEVFAHLRNKLFDDMQKQNPTAGRRELQTKAFAEAVKILSAVTSTSVTAEQLAEITGTSASVFD